MFLKRKVGPAKTITEYREFILQIVIRSETDYITSVIASPAGEGATFRTLPASILDLLSATGSGTQPPGARDVARPGIFRRGLPLKEHGSLLFDLLFHGVVRDLYLQSRALARDQGRGLRVRLKFDLENLDASYLSRLPWEILFDPINQEFLSLARETPVIRYLDLGRPPEPLLPQGVLRVLVVIPDLSKLQQNDLHALGTEREKRSLQSAGEDKDIEVTFIDSLGTLRDTALGSPFHVVHFIGHGGFEPLDGEGFLCFEEEGRLRHVTGQALATELGNLKDLRLVVLNACHTARTTGKGGVNPFAGVATALLKAGIPTVIAMQRAISDSAAIAFSSVLYKRLAAGDPIDAALVEGRLSIFRQETASDEWAVPILFARSDTGIFRPTREATPSKTFRKLGLILLSSIPLLAGIIWVRTKAEHARAMFAIEQGKASLMTNAPIRARESFLSALQLDDEIAAEAYHGLGLVDLAENKPDDAVTHLRQGLDRDKNNQEINFDMGRALEKKGRQEEAVEYFKKSLQAGGCNPEAAAALGSLLGRLGKSDEAERVLSRGIECDPNNMDLSIGMAELLLARGKTKEALARLDQAAHFMPRMDMPQSANYIQKRMGYISVLKGKVYFKMKDLQDACVALEVARGWVDLDGESQEIRTKCERSFPFLYH